MSHPVRYEPVSGRSSVRRVPLLLPALAMLLWAAQAQAQGAPERFAVIAGNNLGQGRDVPLRYAEADAAKLYTVLKDLGGFRPENILLLQGEPADTVRQAIVATNERIRRLSGPDGPGAMLFVYYSGHADASTLHLGPSELALRELRQLVEGSAAAFRVLVLDACHSGAVIRSKGGRVGPPLSIAVERQILGEGTVVLTASAATEDALESDEIRGSFFTHYLVSGLLGAADANQDGSVVLEEAYRYAYEHTVRASSRTTAGIQHPTFRYELHGRGQVVLTSLVPTGRHALVSLPAGRSYLFLRGDADGPVIAEVGATDRVRRISVPAGRYFVRGRAREFLLEGMVSLVGGREVTIGDQTLERIEYARLVRKGSTLLSAVHGPQAGLRLRSAVFESGACVGPYFGYAWETEHVDVVPRLGWCSPRGGLGLPSELASSGPDTRNEQVDLELGLARTWDVSRVAVSVGLAAGLALLADTAEVEGSKLAPYRTVALLGSMVGVSTDLGGGFYARVEGHAHTYLQRKRILIYGGGDSRLEPSDIENQIDTDLVLQLGAGVGMRW
jgi:hypothetical protein